MNGELSWKLILQYVIYITALTQYVAYNITKYLICINLNKTYGNIIYLLTDICRLMMTVRGEIKYNIKLYLYTCGSFSPPSRRNQRNNHLIKKFYYVANIWHCHSQYSEYFFCCNRSNIRICPKQWTHYSDTSSTN